MLGNISSAARQWDRGEDCLAAIHLAFTGLPKLDAPREAARRLFIADGLLEGGIAPRIILNALDIDTKHLQELLKFDPGQPRVPAGNSIFSGRWVAELGEFLTNLPNSAVGRLATFVVRYGARLGYLAILIPTPAGGRNQSGAIPGLPGFSYSWKDDETELEIIHSDGAYQGVALRGQLGADGVFRDSQNHAVAQLVQGKVVVDTEMMSERARNAVNDNDRPKLCPDPVQDKPGGDVDGEETEQSERAKNYEDYVKRQINPGKPTLRGMGYALLDLSRGGKPVIFDDCQYETGTMIEAKGPGYADKLTGRAGGFMQERFEQDVLEQATRQIQAAGARDVEWHFAEKEAADAAEVLFQDPKRQELNRIRVVFDYWRE